MSNNNNEMDVSSDIPQYIIDQIGEFSPDGFLLFTISQEGDIELYTKDSPQVLEVGLRDTAIKILSNLNNFQDSQISAQIMQQKMQQSIEEEEADTVDEEYKEEFPTDEEEN